MGGILISDVEGVLLSDEYLPKLAEREGKAEEVLEITEKGIKGDISWERGLRERLHILQGTSIGNAKKVVEELSFTKGARDLTQELRKRDYTLIGVTGGFKLFAEKVKDELELDYIISNELEFKDGKLKGLKKLNVGMDEIVGLEEILKDENADKRTVTAIADGANNLMLFKHADKKIAFNAQKIIKEEADHVIKGKDLKKALDFMP
ncbi:MAG: phosphoserine phosphatase SerB [Candidatus Hadarchaeota archaeon]